MRKLPPLNALKAFEATARLGGVIKAADELCVTHGAVSRHLKQLESWLGLALFDRSERSLSLTEQGQSYLNSIGPALDLMHQGTQQILSMAEQKLRIATTHSFASRWLMPRLPAFYQENPDLEVWLTLEQRHTGFVGDDAVDLAIRTGAGPWPNLDCQPLLRDRLLVVCRPDIWRAQPRQGHEAILALPLLHDRDPQTDWSLWFQQAGIKAPASSSGARFNSADLLLEAAARGEGVALVSEVLAANELAQGHLIQVSPVVVDLGVFHWLVQPPLPASDKRRTLVRWLLSMAAKMQDTEATWKST